MTVLHGKEKRVFEAMLIVVTLGMTFLLYQMGGYKVVILNLFFLPIVLSGYFLGRTSSGTLALFCILAVSVVVTTSSVTLASFSSPIMLALALTVWGASLGLTAILVGTLCDERAKTVDELHAAYVGVVEVLSKYLQSADTDVKARSIRVAELCQAVAERMRLSRKEIDDTRVGALLYDLGNVEITTQLLSRAVDTLEAHPTSARTHTFSGRDLVHSLGAVLSGAVPLLLHQGDSDSCTPFDRPEDRSTPVPAGARVIRAVRAYDSIISGTSDNLSVQTAVQDLRKDIPAGFDPDVLDALEYCVGRSQRRTPSEPVLA